MKGLLVTLAAVACLTIGVALGGAHSPLLAASPATEPDPAAVASPHPGNSFPAGSFVGVPTLLAEGWAAPVNVSNSAGPSGAPVMALDSTGAVHTAWYDNAPGNWDIMYAVRSPGGAWSDPENASANASYSLAPFIIADHFDSIGVVWQDYGGPRIASQGTLLFRVREPGQDFAPFEPISRTQGFGGYPEVRDPSIALDSHNTLHLTWAGNTILGYRIFYSRKVQGGKWTEPVVLNSGSGTSVHPHLVVDSSDVLHAVWQELTAAETQLDIFYSTLMSNGQWAAPLNITHNDSNSQEPWIMIDSHDTLHLVWRDYLISTEQAEVYYASMPRGGTWSAAENISHTGGDSAGPVLVGDASGTLHLVWYDNSPGNWEILYATRPLGGSWTSGANVSQTPGRSGQPSLIYDPRGRLHLAWADDAAGDFDVFYTTKVVPVFSTSFKLASATARAGDNIAYTVVIKNPSPLPVSLSVVDTLPAETAYVADSAQATTGSVSVSGNVLTWNGDAPAGGQAEITFAAAVNAGVPVSTIIRNRADISDGGEANMSVEAGTLVVLTRLFMPLIVQAH